MNDERPLLIAGATGYGAWPANSLEGALACLKAPIDGIEIDVQITADGHVVAHHDYRLSPDQRGWPAPGWSAARRSRR